MKRFHVAATTGVLVLMMFLAMYAAGADQDDPAIKLVIRTTPKAAGAEAAAEVTGGEPPYRFRWSLGWYDQPQIGGDGKTLTELPIGPWLRELVCCVVTDSRGHTSRAFRHVLPLPPGERTTPIRFFGIGDSIENGGGKADDPQPAIIAVAAQICEQAMGLPTGGIPFDRSSYPGYTSAEIAQNLPKLIDQVKSFGATDIFIRMGLNDPAHDAAATADTILKLAQTLKKDCPSVERIWLEPCTGRAESDDRLFKIAQQCKNFREDWLYYTCDAPHWHQRRAPNLYPDETHAGPAANRALGICRAAAWITQGPPSNPDGKRPVK